MTSVILSFVVKVLEKEQTYTKDEAKKAGSVDFVIHLHIWHRAGKRQQVE